MAKIDTEKKTEKETENKQKNVVVRLYLGDRAETKQPVNVYVNGVKYTIPRGKDVEVPDFVAAVLKDAEDARVEEMEFNQANEMVKYN